VPASPAKVHTDVAPTVVRLLVLGFSPTERKLIQGAAALTQRRSCRLELVDSDSWTAADVILLDGADAKVVAWAAGRSALGRMTVIWVDGPNAATGGATQLRRPVQWPILAALVQRARGQELTESIRQALANH
jgi:hypothetical protein